VVGKSGRIPLVKTFTNGLLALLADRNRELAMETALTDAAYDSKIEGNVFFTQVDAAINWMRKNSLWPMPMGLACCAIELMATGASRFDISRFGAEVMRFSPRQADVMIVSGTVTYKMALAVKRIWDQMPEPKWCIAMGACASSGGMYRSYAVLQGIDRLIPVDVYISGCPPRPEALLEGLMRLQRKIEKEPSFVEQKKALLAELA
jgi:NADH-quinone oxidoreductase subunit B